ncbi:helix-turn-helix domain-containing protein [Zymobacter sp. IVIA_12111.31 C1]|uniref:helix-turn-helix domain-containing protein n=1 Tax=Zymobacter sp. IVIA_12111.31 C1 TaxID=3394854 RepID=UPI0039C19C60
MNLSPEKKALFAERLKQASIAKNGGKTHGIASMLAKMMDVSVQAASKWLSGKAVPDAHRWGEIAAHLNVSASWLAGASHETPEGIDYNKEQVAQVTRAAKLVFPLISRLKPDAQQEQIEEVIETAYLMILAGENDEAVTGSVVSKLLKF